MARDKFLSASSTLSMAARLRRPDDSRQGRISLAVQRFGSRSSESGALPALSEDLLYRASITEAHRREIADPNLFEFNGSHFEKHTCHRNGWHGAAS